MEPEPTPMEGILEFATTERQREVVKAVVEHCGIRPAARALRCHPKTVRGIMNTVYGQAARRGYAPEHDINAPTPPGYVLRGTSTLYGDDGEKKLQWVKTREDWLHQLEAMREAMDELFADVKPKRPKKKIPRSPAKDLLALYPEGDPHWGMRVWGQETDGTNYDLNIAVEEYHAAVDHLVEKAPATETAVALNVGDNFHADNPENMTRRSGNHLQVDGRLAKVFQTVLEARAYKVERMLEKHEKVIVREVYGNHDEVLCMGFTKALIAYYRNEPRVEVVDSPNTWWHYQFGDVMLGTTHGDRCKIPQMPLLMATDAPEMWGNTKFRHCYTGHQHHLERWEEPGCMVEMLRTLAARNEYEQMAGYRAGREMMVRIFHRRYGEVLTHRLGIDLVHALLEDERKRQR